MDNFNKMNRHRPDTSAKRTFSNKVAAQVYPASFWCEQYSLTSVHADIHRQRDH